MANIKFYFSHDVNARKDPKCQALISEYGLAGYGLYFSLVEIMHEQGGKIKKFPKLYDGLSYELRINKDILMKQVEAMLHDFNLLIEDDEYIWSNRVLLNLDEQQKKYIAKVEAGRLGGISSGISRNKEKSAKQNEAPLPENEAPLEQNEAKRTKLNKIKLNKTKINISIPEKSAETTKRFTPPELLAVEEYCKMRKNSVNAQKWYDYYESKGWLIGKSPMKDWKAAVRTWEHNEKNGFSKEEKSNPFEY